MYDKAVDTCLFVSDFVSDWYKTQESVLKLFPKKPLC